MPLTSQELWSGAALVADNLTIASLVSNADKYESTEGRLMTFVTLIAEVNWALIEWIRHCREEACCKDDVQARRFLEDLLLENAGIKFGLHSLALKLTPSPSDVIEETTS